MKTNIKFTAKLVCLSFVLPVIFLLLYLGYDYIGNLQIDYLYDEHQREFMYVIFLFGWFGNIVLCMLIFAEWSDTNE